MDELHGNEIIPGGPSKPVATEPLAPCTIKPEQMKENAPRLEAIRDHLQWGFGTTHLWAVLGLALVVLLVGMVGNVGNALLIQVVLISSVIASLLAGAHWLWFSRRRTPAAVVLQVSRTHWHPQAEKVMCDWTLQPGAFPRNRDVQRLFLTHWSAIVGEWAEQERNSLERERRDAVTSLFERIRSSTRAG